MKHPLPQTHADGKAAALASAPPNTPRASASRIVVPLGSAPLDNLRRGETGRDQVLWKTCGTEKFPVPSMPKPGILGKRPGERGGIAH